MMKIISTFGREDLAILYIAEVDGRIVEFVESVQPPVSRDQKWVLIVSTLFGCPIRCAICDAGGDYQGKISAAAIFEQIDYMVRLRFPDRRVPIPKFKIQFARMGEPTLNPQVLAVLRDLPGRYFAPGLMPCISTIAPRTAHNFLDELTCIKNEHYRSGRFQLQFSIHSTDDDARKRLMPADIWRLPEIAEFGRTWFSPGDRKITLNFAVASDAPIDPDIVADIFEPDRYLIKLTPVNPTQRAQTNHIRSEITPQNADAFPLAHRFERLGFKVLVSYGEGEENRIGSNCGQYASRITDVTSTAADTRLYAYPGDAV